MPGEREDVLAVTRRIFPEREPSEIMAILDGYGSRPNEPERERVQRAILELSDGQESKLLYFVEAARRDYRDVLSWLESAQVPPAHALILGVLQRNWAWALSDARNVLRQNQFGNLLVELADRSIWRVCPEDLAVTRVAESAAELAGLWSDDEFRSDWIVEPWVELARSTLGPLADGKCYGFKLWPVLGGEYAADNMAIKSHCEWLAVSGDVGKQVSDLPPGTPIQIAVRDA